jgi:hypothetical protein
MIEKKMFNVVLYYDGRSVVVVIIRMQEAKKEKAGQTYVTWLL